MLWSLLATQVAAPGMYRIDHKNKRAVLVLMWATIVSDKTDTMIVPVTVETINEVWPIDEKTLVELFTTRPVTSQIPSNYTTIR